MARGRPKSPIQSLDPTVQLFFEEIDNLGLSISDLARLLAERYENAAPSYRTLQEWRRGTHTPHYAPLDSWLKEIQKRHRGNYKD